MNAVELGSEVKIELQIHHASKTEVRNTVDLVAGQLVSKQKFLVVLGAKNRRSHGQLNPSMRLESLQEKTLEITGVGNSTIYDGLILGV